jgi:hypothetical protein
MATATSKRSAATEAAPPEPTEAVEQTDEEREVAEREAKVREAQAEQDKALETLEPKAEPREWLIGKPPEKGGTDDEYSRYIQRPLGYMQRMRFFALVSKTVADALRAGGTGGLGDVFGGGSLRDRASQLTESDFADAGSFMALAMQLISESPDFLLDCYMIWLDVPTLERTWAKRVMEQPFDPERNKWGLTDDQGLEMVEIFIDQNYADIREFFTGKLPQLVQRVREREQESKKDSPALESESGQSKR